MHTKQTVRYIREVYTHTGRTTHYKQEIITDSSWQDIGSLRWSALRPISERTYRKAQSVGYVCVERYIDREPARVIDFPIDRVVWNMDICRPGIVRLMRRIGL